MIEFLSNANWLSPQIDFLLFLQNMRTSHFNMLNDLFLSVTIIGEFWLPTVICAIVYWCIDFKSGIYLLSLSSYNMFFAQLFKMIACVYRPWVLSDKILPVKKALALAIGYSFPSGHSAEASAFLGGLAFLLRKKLVVSILLILLVFMVGFSRMWLGVHTPQDVIVGLLIGFSLVFVLNSVVEWAEKDKNRYLYIMGITDAAIIVALSYICYFNSYPMDYVNGELLVNPVKSIQTSIVCYGYIAGIMNGMFLCRRFFPFNPNDVGLKTKVIRGVVGSIFVIILFQHGIKTFFSCNCDFKIVFAIPFLSGLFITAIYPMIFEKIRKH